MIRLTLALKPQHRRMAEKFNNKRHYTINLKLTSSPNWVPDPNHLTIILLNNRTSICIISVIIISVISVINVISGCNGNETDKEPVARVYDSYLNKSDIRIILPQGISYQDSISLSKSYIDNWIRQRLILHKAELNLTDKSRYIGIEKQLQDYRNSLINYTYKEELIRQKLDTVVTDKEIEDYYTANLKNFELKDNIIKVIYVKVGKNSPGLNKVRKWYRADDDEGKILLEEYCHQFALTFFLDDNSWILFDDLLKEVPINTYNKDQFLKYNRFLEVEDSLNRYFVNIKDFKIKNSISPMSFEKDNIRHIILNKRKLMLIKKMEESVYQEALANNDFEIY